MNEMLEDAPGPLEPLLPAGAPDPKQSSTQDIQSSADQYANSSVTNTSQITAANSGSRFVDLPLDVFKEILDHHELLTASDLLNLTRSCKELYSRISTSQLYHHIRFTIPKDSSSGASQAQKFISVLDQHPERSSWVHEASFTRVYNYDHSWGLELQESLLRLPSSLHTLKIRTLCPEPVSRWGSCSCLDTTVSRLTRLTSLKSLVFEDPCLMLRSVAQVSRLENLKHLRVRWAHEETAEADLLATGSNYGPPSTVTTLELLTPLVPQQVSVNYILQFYPSMKKLSCK